MNFNAFDDECTMVEFNQKINTEPCYADEGTALGKKQFINVARKRISDIMSKSSKKSSRGSQMRYLDNRQKS